MLFKKLTKYEPTRSFTVDNDGFYGNYYKPEKDYFPGKVLVIFGGAAGSFTLTKMNAEKFYEAGMNVLAIAYRNTEGTPSTLSSIPIELIQNAIIWAKENVASKVGVWGVSLGGELSLLTGSIFTDLISCVVAVNPMNFSQQGMDSFKNMNYMNCSCFTYKGNDLPYYPFSLTSTELKQRIKKDSHLHHEFKYLSDYYTSELSKMDNQADYMIKVENIKGSVLLLSAGSDTLLPSNLICKIIYERLESNQFAYPFEHHNYEIASHYLLPAKPLTTKMFQIERKMPIECEQSRMNSFNDTLLFLKEKW